MGETHGHYSKKALVVSQTEPTNPSDGLLWYKPDLCETTTTTTCIGEYIDAPAPENVTITPNAVGSNPVTWYYRAIYGTGNPSPTNRSLVTEESSFIIGDSTNEIILDGAIIPSWASYITLILGTISGNYPYTVGASLFPTDIFELWIDPGYGNLYPLMLTIPIHQDWNGCGDEPTTTTTTPQ